MCTDTAAFHWGDSQPDAGVLSGEGGPKLEIEREYDAGSYGDSGGVISGASDPAEASARGGGVGIVGDRGGRASDF